MILFRCDANPRLGFGHLSRCRELALALKAKGHSLALYGPPEASISQSDVSIFDAIRPVAGWTGSLSDAKALISFGAQINAKAYVLDDYRIDEAYQLHLKEAGARWLQIDPDGHSRLWADLATAAHIAARDDTFRALLDNPDGQLLIGPRYALIKSDFQNQTTREVASKAETVLLTFGAGSDRGAFQTILPLLLEQPDIHHIILASGANNPANEDLELLANGEPDRIELHIQTSNMSALMRRADYAIMAAGNTSLEAAAMGLPMVLITIADNQILPAEAWERTGGADHLGPLDELSHKALERTINTMKDQTRRQAMSSALYQVGVDGHGAERVADAIDGHLLNR